MDVWSLYLQTDVFTPEMDQNILFLTLKSEILKHIEKHSHPGKTPEHSITHFLIISLPVRLQIIT